MKYYNYSLPPNPNTESEETICQYKANEVARRAHLAAHGFIEINEIRQQENNDEQTTS